MESFKNNKLLIIFFSAKIAPSHMHNWLCFWKSSLAGLKKYVKFFNSIVFHHRIWYNILHPCLFLKKIDYFHQNDSEWVLHHAYL